MDNTLVDISSVTTPARAAAHLLAQATTGVKNQALESIAQALLEHEDQILEANARDLARAAENGMPASKQDRLMLDHARIADIAQGVRFVAGLSDPVGVVKRGIRTDNGLRVTQISVPLGVIGMIYEARPNVTVDAASLALKSGNAVILRGGSDAEHTNAVSVALMRDAVASVGLPADAIATVDPWGRAGAQAMMQARGAIDVLIPRGGAGLIRAVVDQATVPAIETGTGNCHVYVDQDANLDQAAAIIMNAKVQRPSVCNAAETLLVHEAVAEAFLPVALKQLIHAGVTVHADQRTCRLVAEDMNLAALAQLGWVEEATQEDWETEYGTLDLAVKVVPTIEAAIDHIRQFSTGHTEAICTRSLSAARLFQDSVDAAAIAINASTRFTDGGQLGLGAEIGISTQKLHARGPMGLEQLTSTSWIIEGEGTIRA